MFRAFKNSFKKYFSPSNLVFKDQNCIFFSKVLKIYFLEILKLKSSLS